MARIWRKGVALFDAALNGIAALLIAVLLGVVAAGIVSRGVNRPFSWTDELSGVLMVWLACIGWMIATRRHVHIRINVFQDLLAPGPWRVLEIVFQLVVAAVGAIVAWRSVWLIGSNWDVELISMPISGAWLYVPLLPAGIVTVLQAIADLRQSKPAAPPPEVSLL